MRKNKLVWAVRSSDNNFVYLHFGAKPTPSGDEGYDPWWLNLPNDPDPFCYKLFKKATGLSLKVDEPVRVRFSAEVVDA